MTRLASLARLLVRICVTVALLLGLLLWGGVGGATVHVHMLFGALVVIGLWTVSVAALVQGSRVPVAVVGLVWGAITAWFGLAQVTLMPGAQHWVIQLLHLLVGLAAAGLAEMLAGSVERHG